MNETQLVHFLAVYDHGGYSAAANSTSTSRQVLGRSIIDLEEEIGGKLFVRKGRGIEPTELGIQAAELARVITEGITVLKTLGDTINSGQREQSHLVFAVSTHGAKGASFAPEELRLYLQAELPNTSLTIEELTCEACPKALEAELVDAVITIGPIDNPMFSNELIGTREAYLVVSTGNALARRRTLLIRDLKELPLAQPDSLSFFLPRVDELCQEEGFAPCWSYAGADKEELLHFVENGGGVFVRKDAPFGIETPNVRHVPLDKTVDLDFPFYCVSRKHNLAIDKKIIEKLRTLFSRTA